MPFSVVRHSARHRLDDILADPGLTSLKRIQAYLNLLGPELDVSRACFNVNRGRVYTTEVEWAAPGVKSSLGEKVSARIIENLVKDDIQELNKETANELLPRGLRLISGSVLTIMEVLQRVVSIVAAPFRHRGELVAVVSFDICKERREHAGWSRYKLGEVGELLHRFNSAFDDEPDLLEHPPFA